MNIRRGIDVIIDAKIDAEKSVGRLASKCAKLKAQNERYRDALIYARGQSDRGNQIVGVEDATYFAWIHERCSKALKLKRTDK